MAHSPDREMAESGKHPVWPHGREARTRHVLIIRSRQELAKLRADAMVVVAAHFQTEDHAKVALKLAHEAEEMWDGDHATVPDDEWPNAHLHCSLAFTATKSA